MTFSPDAEQEAVLRHDRGPMLVTGPSGTGKTAVLTERFARLVEGGADPERIALVVRTRRARGLARRALLARVSGSLPALRVVTVHGLAYHVVSARFARLGYREPPPVLSAVDQFSKVGELMRGEDPASWPAYGSMLGLRGFADQLRQFVLRAQEALLAPEQVEAMSAAAGLTGWAEVARFYRRYLQVLDAEGTVDYAGLVGQAAASAGDGEPLFNHVLVDDYQDATYATERLVVELKARSLVVAGDADAHVFSFQGTTDVPLRRFSHQLPETASVVLATPHRSGGSPASMEARLFGHSSEEYAEAARELRRVHVEDRVPWARLAIVVRRQGTVMGGVLRALDDAGIPRSTPETRVSFLAETPTLPYLLALRWLSRPQERDGLIESLLTSELARLSPAEARGLVRSARSAGQPPAAALDRVEDHGGLAPGTAESLRALKEVLAEAEPVASRSVLDAFAVLWKGLSYSRRLVAEAEKSARGRRDLDSVDALSGAIARAGERGELGASEFLDLLDGGEEGLGFSGGDEADEDDAVRVLTAHGAVGLEFDTVIVVGTVEGDFPSLSRPEPMFDLAALEHRISQSERNRFRLEDERRLFGVVTGRARRRIVVSASAPSRADSLPAVPSRFVAERGIPWTPSGHGRGGDPLTVSEAAAAWRRSLADGTAAPADRLAALRGLLALGVDPQRWWFQRDWTDTGRPLHDETRTSYSKLDVLENCHLQYVLSEELGLDDRAGYHAWVGHMVHRLIEDCENGLIERNIDALVAAVQERWRREEFPSLAVSEAFRRLVVEKMLPSWFKLYGATPALAKEVHFAFEHDGATVSGYIDRIGGVERGGTVITDYKTGKAHDVATPADNLQLGVYYLAVAEAEELAEFRPVRAVELAYLKEANRRQAIPGPIAIAQLPITSKTRGDYEATVRERLSGLVGTVRELLETENYRPNPGADCYFCRFRSLCPLFPEGAELFPSRAGASS
ncbi:ATP-dependent DNA helicase [soil metagenome]